MRNKGKRLCGTMSVLLAGGMLAVSGPAGALAAGELNMMVWEGYTDPSFVEAFEEQSGCRVTSTFVGTNDDFAPKLQGGGGVFDLVIPSADGAQVLMAAGLVESIDVSRIEAFNDTYEIFRKHPATYSDGMYLGVPYTWGTIPYMYRVDAFDTPPTSTQAFWAPENADRVSLWDDKHALYVTAKMLGFDDVYNLTDEQMEAVVAKLIEGKPNVRKYWASAGELVDLFASGEIDLAVTWGGYQSATLNEMGIEVVEFLPDEGAHGWFDIWQIVKGTPNLDCAYAWLNFAISPEGQCGVARVTGYSAANPVAARECMTDDEFAARNQDNIDLVNSLTMWEMPPRLDYYLESWSRVKAAPIQ